VILWIIVASSTPVSAEQNRLVIRTVDVNAQATGAPAGVPATVMVQSLKIPETLFAPIDASGTYETTPFTCEPGMNFRAEPKSKMIYSSGGSWKPCSYDGIVFEFSRNKYADNIQVILKLDYGKFAKTNPAITALGQKLVKAADAGSFGDIPVLSTELMVQFEDANRLDLAQNAKIVALQATGTALGVEDPLAFDPVQKSYVFSADTMAALADWQTQNNIDKTGKVDWPTMKYLSKKFGDDAVADVFDLKSNY
jgi:hypothetical protein